MTGSETAEDAIERSKQLAAEKAVKATVQKGMILGIGSGSTIVYAVKKIAQLNQVKDLNLTCIPTSFQSYQLIVDHGLQVGTLDQYPQLDLDIDGADELDKKLNAIKGGGGCLVQEKIVAASAKELIFIADYRKHSTVLGENWKRGVPIEIIPLARVPLIKKFQKLGGIPQLRLAKAKSGPVVTDNGNFIIDVNFGLIDQPGDLHQQLILLPGVVDTGLFVNMASKAYIGQSNGSVEVLVKQ